MTKPNWVTLKGKLEKGYRVASGPSDAYPEYGSIEKQKPYFKELGLDLEHVFNGTLNISIEPHQFRVENPQYRFPSVKWTELTYAEDFSFSRCRIKFQGTEYDGFVYYPDPKTKKEHFQSASTIEVLAPYVDGIKYEDELEISLNMKEIKVVSPA
ncbi:MAG TPA: hypothetical protein VK851_04885 [Anaerolineales bacterium]|nr:hypothetical protein [Anaerolineales bacterium]